MRKAAWVLLLVLAFAIPWEYSLDFGPPFGNIARLAAIGVVLAVIPAILKAGRMRTSGSLQWMLLALFLWFCFSCFWSIDPTESVRHLRGYFQEFIVVWLVWELANSPRDLYALVRAYVAGAGVLAVLTIINFATASSPWQVRFVAEGQDPNDVARFLDLALPLAALLVGIETGWPRKLLAAAYLPIGMLGVLLTASRSGLLAALVALAGCAALLFYNNRRGFVLTVYALPIVLSALWIIVPQHTLERLATIPGELWLGDFNQRADIWASGWQAVSRAPICGYGIGSFVVAAGVASIDTAHNTMLVLFVEGGIIALFIAAAIAFFTAVRVVQLRGPLRIAMGAAFLTLTVGSLVATVQENRVTWLLVGLIAAAARLTEEDSAAVTGEFPQQEFTSDASGFTNPATQESP